MFFDDEMSSSMPLPEHGSFEQVPYLVYGLSSIQHAVLPEDKGKGKAICGLIVTLTFDILISKANQFIFKCGEISTSSL